MASEVAFVGSDQSLNRKAKEERDKSISLCSEEEVLLNGPCKEYFQREWNCMQF